MYLPPKQYPTAPIFSHSYWPPFLLFWLQLPDLRVKVGVWQANQNERTFAFLDGHEEHVSYWVTMEDVEHNDEVISMRKLSVSLAGNCEIGYMTRSCERRLSVNW